MPIGYWESELLLAPVDLTVIGAGIVGMSTALHFKALCPEATVRIVERDMLGEGGTTRNAGFACFGGAGEWLDDRGEMGKEAWKKLLTQRIEGLSTLINLLGEEAIGLEWTGGWELFSDDAQGKSRAKEALEALEELNADALPLLQRGLVHVPAAAHEMPALLRDSNRAQHFGAAEALHLPWEGMIHTGKMVQAFHRALEQQGIQKLHGCSVDHIKAAKIGSSWALCTKRGMLESRKVAICTNGFAQSCIADAAVAPKPNRVLVVSPKNPVPRGTYHMEDGYLYFRTLPDGKVLFGGGRHFGISLPDWPNRDTEAESQWDAQLLSSAAQWLGPIHEVTHRWTGWLGIGPDRTPLIGQTDPGLFYAVRLGGMGIAIGCGLGRVLAQKMAEEESKDG